MTGEDEFGHTVNRSTGAFDRVIKYLFGRETMTFLEDSC